jgi:hypothetical protein
VTFFGPAFISEGVLALSIGFGMLVVVPIVALLSAHQRKMAEIFRQQQTDPALLAQIQRLQDQLDELRDRVNQRFLDDNQVRPEGNLAIDRPQVPGKRDLGS